MSAYEIYSVEDDEAAFASVYRAHHDKLLRYCQYRLRDRHEAEDVVQEAFARAWRTMPVGRPDSNFYPWLRVVAGNLCTDILRKRSRSEPVAVIDIAATDRDLDRLTDESDRALVRQALGRLNDRHRSALMMREHEGLTYDQIAERTGATAGTVESLLWRARQALKREFTVLAGREGCLAVVPVVVALAVRLRGAGRRAWYRLARRLPGVDPSSETQLTHAALAALAAVATGAVALGFTGGGSAPPGVVVRDQTRPAAVTVPARTAAPPTSTVSPGGAASSPVGPDPRPATTTVPVLTAPAYRGGATPPPLRLQPPVVVGKSASTYAHNAPVGVQAGDLAVGLSPTVAQHYLQTTALRVSTALPALPGAK